MKKPIFVLLSILLALSINPAQSQVSADNPTVKLLRAYSAEVNRIFKAHEVKCQPPDQGVSAVCGIATRSYAQMQALISKVDKFSAQNVSVSSLGISPNKGGWAGGVRFKDIGVTVFIDPLKQGEWSIITWVGLSIP